MKKKLLVLLVVITVILGSGLGTVCAAATSTSLNAGSFGFSAGFDTNVDVLTISARYFLQNDLAVRAGLGFQASSGDLDGDFFSMLAGIRKYLSTGEFAPFVEGRFTYISENMDVQGVDTDTWDLSANFGAEYFLHKQFSLEGSVGLAFGSVDDNVSHRDYNYFGTRTVGVSANFYF